MYRFALSICFLLTACSSLPWDAPAEKKVAVAPRIITREPGSLWSEDSRWNTLFDSAPYRGVGDALRVEITELFTKKMAELQTPEGKPAKAGDKSAEKAPGEKPGEKGKGAADATIVEVLPRGVYRIQVPNVKSSGAETGFSALVREKDIGPNDTIKGETLFNVRIDGNKSASKGGVT